MLRDDIRVGDHVNLNSHRLCPLSSRRREIQTRHSGRHPSSNVNGRQFITEYDLVNGYRLKDGPESLVHKIEKAQSNGKLFRIIDLVHDNNGRFYAIPDLTSLRGYQELLYYHFRRHEDIKIGFEYHNIRLVARDAHYNRINEPPRHSNRASAPSRVSFNTQMANERRREAVTEWSIKSVEASKFGESKHSEMAAKLEAALTDKTDKVKETNAGVLMPVDTLVNPNYNNKVVNKIKTGLKTAFKSINIEFKNGSKEANIPSKGDGTSNWWRRW